MARSGPARAPVLFVTHGAPTLPVEDGAARRWFEGLAAELPRPRAVLCVSAHWQSEEPVVSAAERPETIHDFYGFPDELYEIRYPAPGAPALAARVRELLGGAGLCCEAEPGRGLDHGAWVPMKLIWPEADVPVTQLSIQTRLGPAYHLTLGRTLAPLREEGVLILGSGSATHNLREFGAYAYDDPAPDYVTAFNDWLVAAVLEGRLQDLLNYRDVAPEAARNHPSEEHFLPLFVALGAAMDSGAAPAARLLHTSTVYGIVAMTSFAFA